jgi:dihydrofolate reductase
MTTTAIVISTEVGGIGINGRMPWLEFYSAKDAYQELAKNNIVLVGRKSFDSHPHLRGEVTYVYSNNVDLVESDSVKRVSGSADDIISMIKETHPDKNIIIAGGVNVFKAFWDHIDEWRVTIVKEFVVYEEDIDLTSIQYHWNDRRLLGEGVDNNQNFEIWHYRKKV